MLYTGYFALAKKYRDIFDLVSVSRITPSWFEGKEIKAFAPSETLLFSYKNGDVSEEEYDEIYTKETLSKINFEFASSELDRFATDDFLPIWESKTNDAILCCYEKDGDFCHRHLLSKKLNEIGIECCEITRQMIETKIQKLKETSEYECR